MMRISSFSSYAIALALLAPALLAPGIAFGVMRDGDFERERLNAMHHVQVRILKIAVPVVTPGDCRIWGEVVALFKGAKRYLREGTKLEFDISCKRRNDLIPTGDTQWLEVAQLQDTRFIEAYLNSTRDGGAVAFRVPAWQYRIIEAPTSNPQCPDTTKGPDCTSFTLPKLDVQKLTRRLVSNETTIRVTISEDILDRLRLIAAQHSAQGNRGKTSVSDVVSDLLENNIDALEAEVR